MAITYRLVTIAVIEAILLLVVGIGDAFVDTSTIRDLVYHSYVFHIVVFVVCWFAAPLFQRAFRLSDKRGSP
jgi:hypothetical protein